MMEKIKALFEKWSTEGMRFPFIKDGTTGKPSVTLLFTYTAFFLSYIGVIVLMIKNLVQGVIAAMTLWTTATIFYLLRRLSKASIDLDDKKIDLEGEKDDE